MSKYYLFFILFLSSVFHSWGFSQDTKTDSSSVSTTPKNRESRGLGDIFLGFKIAGGLTDILHRSTNFGSDTRIVEKGMYFYNLGVMGEFYLAPYSSIVVDISLHNIRFDRKTHWSDGPMGEVSSEKPYEQWFNRFTLGARFLFWNLFYVQTGPTMLVNYNSKALESFMGVSPTVNDSRGVSMQWQAGLGVSAIVGHQANGEPLMTFDASFFAYIPVAGYIVDNRSSTNSGGTPLHTKSNPYQFEFSLAFMFLIG